MMKKTPTKNSRYRRAPFVYADIMFKNHPFVGVIWEAAGSKGSMYEVEMCDKGFSCTCHGFAYHGKCRHIHEICEKIA